MRHVPASARRRVMPRRRRWHAPWSIPGAYASVSIALGLLVPRLETTFLADWSHGMSPGAALAFFSSVSSGMMALTGIVFAIAFVVVQFGAVAYSPRLVTMYAGDPRLYHALGVFFATFCYSLAALGWTDRGGNGRVPLISTFLVGLLVVASMLFFTSLVHSLYELQIHNVLRSIAARGRQVIAEMFRPLPADAAAQAAGSPGPGDEADLGPVTQTILHAGNPRVVDRVELAALGALAASVRGTIVLDCAVGDTVLEGTTLLRVHAGTSVLDEAAVMEAVLLSDTRSFEQDPKYAIRLLVDIAIRALSPAINDPTTAVQAVDQIEDLLRRLASADLAAGTRRDGAGIIRVIVPVPSWEDYLSLAFDEIRQFGATSVQVLRRLRSALMSLANYGPSEARREAARLYLRHLDLEVDRSEFDDQDRVMALQEDRQGLGMPRASQK